MKIMQGERPMKMLEDEIVYRYEGDRSDIAIVEGQYGVYHVAYQYSKANEIWRFCLDREGHRYTARSRAGAMSFARNRYAEHNGCQASLKKKGARHV
jgi:hypothetical protein